MKKKIAKANFLFEGFHQEKYCGDAIFRNALACTGKKKHGQMIIVNTPRVIINLGAGFFKGSVPHRKKIEKKLIKPQSRKRPRNRHKKALWERSVDEEALGKRGSQVEDREADPTSDESILEYQPQLLAEPCVGENDLNVETPVPETEYERSQMGNSSENFSTALSQVEETGLFVNTQSSTGSGSGVDPSKNVNYEILSLADQTGLDLGSQGLSVSNSSFEISASEPNQCHSSFFVDYQYKSPSFAFLPSEMIPGIELSGEVIPILLDSDQESHLDDPQTSETETSNISNERSKSELSRIPRSEYPEISHRCTKQLADYDFPVHHVLNDSQILIQSPHPEENSPLVGTQFNSDNFTSIYHGMPDSEQALPILEQEDQLNPSRNSESGTLPAEVAPSSGQNSCIAWGDSSSDLEAQGCILKRANPDLALQCALEKSPEDYALNDEALSRLTIPKVSNRKSNITQSVNISANTSNQPHLKKRLNETHDAESLKVLNSRPGKSQNNGSNTPATAKEQNMENYYSKNRICEACACKFPDEISFCSHMQRHQNSKAYQCQVCRSSLDTLNLHRLHMQICHRVKSLPENANVNHSKPVLQPEFCYKFDPKHNLFMCSYCDIWFRKVSNVASHQKVLHHGPNPHRCKHCQTRFLNKSLLDKHCAARARQYQCGACGKNYALMDSLASHMIIHSPSFRKDEWPWLLSEI